ncbi:Uncharacterised protein [Streptococcus pneumoniae]|nr:Uncharacterised protein [Streptococcus pneumoniae]
MPHLGGALGRDEGADPVGQAGLRGQAAADPQVVAGAQLGVHDTDQGDVVDLVDHVLGGMSGDGGLELAGQVGDLEVTDPAVRDLPDHGRGVDDLVRGDPGHR